MRTLPAGRLVLLLASAVALSVCASGCGGVHYAIAVNSAASGSRRPRPSAPSSSLPTSTTTPRSTCSRRRSTRPRPATPTPPTSPTRPRSTRQGHRAGAVGAANPPMSVVPSLRLRRAFAVLFACVFGAAACAQGPALHGQDRRPHQDGRRRREERRHEVRARASWPSPAATSSSPRSTSTRASSRTAQAHLAKAEPNAQAAFEMSPPDRCTAREFVEVAAAPVDKDTDGDTILDSRDQCILEPEDMDGYLDDDGCPDPDNDADGILDAADKCPLQPEDMDGWQDDDGCPDPDNDAGPDRRRRRLLPQHPRRARRRPPGLPEEELAHRGDGEGDPHHPADPVRVQQGRHQARDHLQDPRRGGGRPERQHQDLPRGPGPHGQRRQRRLQHEAVADRAPTP